MMDFRRAWLALLVAACAAGAIGGEAAAATPRAKRPGTRPARVQAPSRVATIDNSRRIDANTLNMFVTNYGSFAWDLTSGNAGLVWPKGTNKTAVFAAGIWFGAEVGGEIRTVVSEYSQEYGPGPIEPGGLPADPTNPDFRTWKVVRFTGNSEDTAHVERDADELAIEDPLVHHSWSEYMAGAAPYGAPWKVYKLPRTDTSTPDDSVDVPGPDVLGDQMLWAVYNDADPGRHTNDAGGSAPLGLEIQQTTFAFNRQGALGNIVFIKYLIINKGSDQLDSMFVSLWSDTDLGGAADDLVGVSVPRSLGYTYNSTNNDQLYGSAPPAVGYDFFQGPRYLVSDTSLAGRQPLPMTSFNKYINGTDPSSTSDTYNYMNGFLPDGSEVIDPTTGSPTKFFHPGDPTTRTGWLDSNPADRRHLLTSGPFYMSPGDTQEVVGSVIIGNGNDRLSSISAMFFYDEFAQLTFDLGFQLPDPPPQPQVDVEEEHETVTLCWDSAALTDYDEPGYEFEGYNVYQGASIAGPWKRLATYDLVNGILTVRDTVFDLNTGREIADFPVAFGTDAGLQFCYTTTEDAVRGGKLKDGTEYYFAVTAYAVATEDTTKPKVVENAQVPIRVMPQRPPAGTDLATASATPIAYFQVSTALQPTSDQPIVEVVLPESLKVATYRIAFSPLVPPFSGQVGGDTATVVTVWHLIRTSLNGVATNDTLLKNQINRRGDLDYKVVDGIRVRFVWPEGFELGSYFPKLLRAAPVVNSLRSINPAFNWSGQLNYWLGAAGYAEDATQSGQPAITFHDDDALTVWGGSTLDPVASPGLFDRVELQFGATPSQRAYRFLRYELGDTSSLGLAGDSPPGGRRYTYGGFVTVPLQVMDVLRGRQLDMAYVERIRVDSLGTIMPPARQPASFDSTYRPRGSLGGREYLFVIGRTYDGTADPAIAVDGSIVTGTVPLMYAMWASQRGTRTLESGSPFTFDWVVPATSNDYFTFSTSALQRGNASVAKANLERVRVVPNPYYNRSRYEVNQFNRRIRFINMPEVATVKIFNLAGELVRTLEKTDPTTSVLEWDIQTESQLPVASGIYVFHIDAPGVGSTFGRLVVFMEKERLNNF